MGALTDKQIASYAQGAGLGPAPAAMAVAIALAESTGNASEVSSTGDYGLWQINVKAHPQYDKTKLLGPVYNAAAMAAISKNGTDWSQWTTYDTGAYKKFVARGVAAVGSGLLPNGDPGIDPIGQVVDAAGNVIGGAGDLIGSAGGLATGAARSLLGLDGIAQSVWVAGLGLVLTTGALVLIALGAFRLTGRNPYRTTQEAVGTVQSAASIAAL